VRCGGSGYKRRVGLYELMTVTDDVRKLIRLVGEVLRALGTAQV
jgi:type II secretory ATPase GspE/PulE/Tfp pilus assembly ATPase PilB-like protein